MHVMAVNAGKQLSLAIFLDRKMYPKCQSAGGKKYFRSAYGFLNVISLYYC